ncbi:hypothetical protein N7470_005743 [Penicillium chermesinum]|nr:hypothetical protein N7470_005743 [Penicillium chermesinum]
MQAGYPGVRVVGGTRPGPHDHSQRSPWPNIRSGVVSEGDMGGMGPDSGSGTIEQQGEGPLLSDASNGTAAEPTGPLESGDPEASASVASESLDWSGLDEDDFAGVGPDWRLEGYPPRLPFSLDEQENEAAGGSPAE